MIMNEDSFESALDRWGADLSRWPAETRQAALSLLDTSARARELADRQRRVEDRLQALQAWTPPADLQARIMAKLPRRDRWQRVWDWFAAAMWRPVLVACAPLMIGFAAGAALPDLSDEALLAQVSTLALTDMYQEISNAQQ